MTLKVLIIGTLYNTLNSPTNSNNPLEAVPIDIMDITYSKTCFYKMVGYFQNGRLNNTGFPSVDLRHSQIRMVG